MGKWGVDKHEVLSRMKNLQETLKNFCRNSYAPVNTGQCSDMNVILLCLLRMIGIGSRIVTGMQINKLPERPNLQGTHKFYTSDLTSLHKNDNKWYFGYSIGAFMYGAMRTQNDPICFKDI